jgi:hypothetical protein
MGSELLGDAPAIIAKAKAKPAVSANDMRRNAVNMPISLFL